MAERNIPTNQIAKIQTAKKLIALYDKLKTVNSNYYAQLHAKGEQENGMKQTSLIGITIQDYSNGTGASSIFATYNLAPEQIQFLLSRITAGFADFEWSSEKIFGSPDQNGYSIAQKFFISRHTVDKNGQPLRSPWRIQIQNGKGIKVQNQTGGAYMQGNSFQVEKNCFIALSDMDLYTLLKRADSYITQFELYCAGNLIVGGRNKFEQYMQATKEAAVNSQYQQTNYNVQMQSAAGQYPQYAQYPPRQDPGPDGYASYNDQNPYYQVAAQ